MFLIYRMNIGSCHAEYSQRLNFMFRSLYRTFQALVLGILFMSGISNASAATAERAVFAGGCFWCMHAAFEQLEGVSKVDSGYTGGTMPNPTYEQVSTGRTGHIEAIQVMYDPEKVPYEKLLERFWDNVDPTDPQGQFCDKGSQYLAGIYYVTPQQKEAAENSIAEIEKKLGRKIETFLRPAVEFYPAEEYHQSYYKKNELRYKLYEAGCGRKRTLEKIWKK